MNDRITVVENVYLQTADGDVEAVVTQYERELYTCDQPYERKLVVGKDWQIIETGWIKQPGMMVVKNTKDNATVEVAYETTEEGFLVHGGDSLRVTLSSEKRLRVRCLGYQARILVTAFGE